MQFMRDWFLSSAEEVGLYSHIRELVHGITIDIGPSEGFREDATLVQIFIPYQHDEGLILLRKILHSDIPKVIEVDWYGVGLEASDGKLIIKTHNNGPFFQGKPDDYHFEIAVTREGCEANGVWPTRVEEDVIEIKNISELIQVDESSPKAFEVFICGTLISDVGRKHREICARTVAQHYPSFIPVSLKDLRTFNPDISLGLVSKCDAFIIVITDFVTPWMANEYHTARRQGKPMLVLAHKEILTDKYRSSGIAELRPESVTTYEEENLGGIVARWMERTRRFLELRRILAPSTLSLSDPQFPEVIDLGLKEREWVRIALVQFDYALSPRKPLVLMDERAMEHKTLTAVEVASNNDADFVLLPELSGSQRVTEALLSSHHDKAPSVLITGSSYVDGWNIATLGVLGSRFLVRKRHRSKFEDSPVEGSRMKEARSLRVFETKLGTFCLLICEDFRHDARIVAPLVDILFVQSYNPAPQNFRTRASVLVEDHHCYTLIANASKFGYTAIYGIIDNQYHSDLERASLRDPTGPPAELAYLPPGCEGVLIADLCLTRTGVSVPTPVLEQYANVRDIKVIPIG